MIQRLKRICWLLHLNRFMEKYLKCFKNNNNLFFLRCEEESFKRKIEKKFCLFENFEWIMGGGIWLQLLIFLGCHFWKELCFKKNCLTVFFFNSNIQKFYHWSNNTNKNMMIWAFLKRAVVCKANIQLFLLTTFESQGLFNNYFCHCRSPKFCHF